VFRGRPPKRPHARRKLAEISHHNFALLFKSGGILPRVCPVGDDPNACLELGDMTGISHEKFKNASNWVWPSGN